MALETLAATMLSSVLTTMATDQAKRVLCLVLEELAKRTETDLDDKAVEILKDLWKIK